ncbi:MAG: nuclear transport factor 2 family protein [Gammaproteobacteria bacterium]|nr:nuclear transport factor 2 family protein [Gammaproteobacteria bacterium]MBU6509127.1 nuclear transport factor 2 family protein [Gammaproteobacteria bacterium]MDE1984582.1 nuclear transport factor 2 family protein [Gammaproteobacteria bacterium]MDE2109196.1 nuclear transport factor 2 family protein [Gammaproteobacteria bacterium]MDE2460370.1 nuclear transport factor 2 family protein [Gammaproteobacteria bacterium]
MKRTHLWWRPALPAMLTLLMMLATPQAAMAQPAVNDCGTAVDRVEASGWFRQINSAWERLDAAAATALFADNAEYRDYPFDTPLRGRQAIRTYWNDVARGQRDVHTSYEVLSACGHTSIVHWTASFVRVPSGQKVRLDGIAEITLNEHGKAVLFREWWDREQH